MVELRPTGSAYADADGSEQTIDFAPDPGEVLDDAKRSVSRFLGRVISLATNGWRRRASATVPADV